LASREKTNKRAGQLNSGKKSVGGAIKIKNKAKNKAKDKVKQINQTKNKAKKEWKQR
jgi:hypothetical protein